MTTLPPGAVVDSDEERIRHILDGQRHCDHYLTPLADPAGRSVLVVGCGAGTDVLWALRRGAREVVGIDVVEQSSTALAAAVAGSEQERGAPLGRWELRRLRVEEAASLGRRFDLVLSNNVFEHVPRLVDAFRACAEVVVPVHGRIAIFTSPLFHSAAGAHLPLAPWEHLWSDPAALRERLLAGELASTHARLALARLSLAQYLDDEISLNRMRLGDFLEALRQAGLVILNLRVRCEPQLAELPSALRRARERNPESALTASDLAVEGIGVELARLPDGAGDGASGGEPTAAALDTTSTEERVLAAHRAELESLLHTAREETVRHQRDAAALRELLASEQQRLHEARVALTSSEHMESRLAALREEVRFHQLDAAALRELLAREQQALAGIRASRSYRLVRALAAPLRWPRGRRGGELG